MVVFLYDASAVQNISIDEMKKTNKQANVNDKPHSSIFMVENS